MKGNEGIAAPLKSKRRSPYEEELGSYGGWNSCRGFPGTSAFAQQKIVLKKYPDIKHGLPPRTF